MGLKAALLAILLVHPSGHRLAASTPQITVKDLAEYGLRLLPPTTPEFQEYLAASLKGQIDAKVDVGKPYAVLLQNGSDATLIAYSLRWIGTDFAGKLMPLNTWFIHLLNTDSKVLWINPGDAAIISPHFLVVGHQVQHQAGGSYPDPLDRMAQMASVQICLDAALFKDGRFVGPNETKAYERVVSLPRGRKAVMEEIQSRHANGQSDKLLLDWLQSVTSDPVHSSNFIEAQVQTLRQSAAHMFILTYQKMGSEAAFTLAAREAARPFPHITRVPYSPNLSDAAHKTYVNYNSAIRTGDEPAPQKGAEIVIPSKYWTDPIKGLKPIRVYLHRMNVVVVQQIRNGIEEGKYIYVPISSYMPMSGDDGFEFTPNPRQGSTYTMNGVLDYRRVRGK